jgi:hypothetical protein
MRIAKAAKDGIVTPRKSGKGGFLTSFPSPKAIHTGLDMFPLAKEIQERIKEISSPSDSGALCGTLGGEFRPNAD